MRISYIWFVLYLLIWISFTFYFTVQDLLLIVGGYFVVYGMSLAQTRETLKKLTDALKVR